MWKGKPFKPLTAANNSSKGRNNLGRITSRNHGGGHKHKYRIIDFYRRKFDSIGEIERIEYDPNRSCYIMLVKFEDGEKFYYLAPQNVKAGDKIRNGTNIEIKVGNCMPLQDIPAGIDIHNVELQPGAGGKIARSAGTSVSISGVDGAYSLIKMTSGEVRKVNSKCMATIGVLSNPDQKNIKIGKAGRSRWMGIRPHTRGVVKNPVDHPHGGVKENQLEEDTRFHQLANPQKGLKQEIIREQINLLLEEEKEEEIVMARAVWKGPFCRRKLD